jgi:phage tail sheath gpL-like
MSGTDTNAAVINFTEIPNNWRVPGEYMEVKPAINENAILPFPANGLIMGQMLSSGTATAGVPYPIYTGPQAYALFGQGSMVAEMCVSWIAANPYTPLNAIGIEDAAESVAATGAWAFSGVATAAGTLAAEFAGVRVVAGVEIGDTAAEVAANLAAAIGQQGSNGTATIPGMAVEYTAGASSFTMAALNKGTLGNTLDMRINPLPGDATPAGISVTITPMSGGATDPEETISTALASLTNTWYTDVAFAWTDGANIGTFAAWLTARYGAMVKQDAQGYVAESGTYGTLLTFQPNCKFITPLPVQNSRSPAWKIAAGLAGACCYSSAQNPALQMKTVPLPGIVAPAEPDLFTQDERQTLLTEGFSTFTTDSSGAFYLERVTTSYRSDAGGIPNNAYFDLQATKIPTRVRYDWNNYVAETWPRNPLADDGSPAAQLNPNCVTPSLLMAHWAGRSNVYETAGWIQNSAATAAKASFAIDSNDGDRVNDVLVIQNMGNLMVLAGQLQFISNN